MKSTYTKVIAILLCLALAITAFAACGKKENEDATGTDSETVGWSQTAPTDKVDLSATELSGLVKEALGADVVFDGKLSSLTAEQLAKVTALAVSKGYVVDTAADGTVAIRKNVVLVSLTDSEVVELVQDALGDDAKNFKGDLSALSDEQLKKIKDAAKENGYYVSTGDDGKVEIKKEDAVQSASPQKQEEVSSVIREVLGDDAKNFNGDVDSLTPAQKKELESKLAEKGVDASEAAEIVTKEFTTAPPLTTHKGTYHVSTTKPKPTSSTKSHFTTTQRVTGSVLSWVQNAKNGNAAFKAAASDGDDGAVAVGTAVSGGSTSAIISKFDDKGKVKWTKSVSGNNATYFEDVIVLADGSILAVGNTVSTTFNGTTVTPMAAPGKDGTFNCLVVKYSPKGDVKWAKRFGGSGHDYITSVAIAKDGGLLLGGHTASTDGFFAGVKTDLPANGHTTAYLVKFADSDLSKTLWTKYTTSTKHCSVDDIIVNSAGDILTATDVRKADAEFAAIPDANIGGFKTLISKYPANGGNALFNTFITSSDKTTFTKIADSADGGCIIAGTYSAKAPTVENDGRAGTFSDVFNGGNAGSGDGAIIKIDSNGKVAWKTMMIGFGVDNITNIVATPTGYAVSGYSTSTNRDFANMTGYGDYDCFVVCFNKLGAKQNFIAFGGSETDMLHGLCVTKDNNLFVCGSTCSNDYNFEKQSVTASANSAAAYGAKIDLTVE